MRDPLLARLLSTLDAVPSASTAILPHAAADDFAVAAERLRAASRRLGGAVQESPYLAFARRLVPQPDLATPFAASA